MRKVLAIAILCFLNTFLFGRKEFDTTFPFSLTLSGLMVVELEINGVKTKLIFDTGATRSVISSNLQTRAQVKIHATSNVEDSQLKKQKLVTVKSDNILINQVLFKKFRAFVADLPPPLSCNNVEGLLGMDIISQCHWFIDNDNKTIRITNKKIKNEWAQGQQVVYKNKIRPKADLTINNTTILKDFLFDAGYSGAVEVSRKQWADGESLIQSGEVLGRIGGSVGLFGEGRIDTIYACPDTPLSMQAWQLGKTEVDVEPKTDAKIGQEVFTKFNYWVSGTEKRFVFFPRKTPIEIPKDRYALAIKWQDNKFKVRGLRLCSDVAQAGITIGEEIQSINGKVPSDFTDSCHFDEWYLAQEADLLVKFVKNIPPISVRREPRVKMNTCLKK
jgi:gag-polyprotein putative aspartyl protease